MNEIREFFSESEQTTLLIPNKNYKAIAKKAVPKIDKGIREMKRKLAENLVLDDQILAQRIEL